MSKTVLLPNELYKEIQETQVEIHGVKIEQSMAKKIKLFFDVDKVERMIEEWGGTLESFKTNNRAVWDRLQDEKIRQNPNWENPWKITTYQHSEITLTQEQLDAMEEESKNW